MDEHDEGISEAYVFGRAPLEDAEPGADAPLRKLRICQRRNVVSIVAGGGSHFAALTGTAIAAGGRGSSDLPTDRVYCCARMQMKARCLCAEQAWEASWASASR